MRNPARIEPMLRLLSERIRIEWELYPDMRLGQILNGILADLDCPLCLAPDDVLDVTIRRQMEPELPAEWCRRCDRTLPVPRYHFRQGLCPDCFCAERGFGRL